ncbi:MAG TPA: ribosome maturation factor RimM [Polyangiaceae bacterium]|nr:ribosome maturation factor RimM [Polyangiaceae bacterium]
MLAPNAWVPLAEVSRAHGVRGEVRLRPFNRHSDLLLSLDEVLLRFPDGTEHEVSVDGARRAGDAVLMKLFSVDDRDAADDLRAVVVCAKRSDFPPLEAGEFYACDIEGARVLCPDSGGAREPGMVELGTVRELRTYPSMDILIVDASDGGAPYEVPLIDSIVRMVDVIQSVVLLSTLQGVERSP